MRVFGNSLVVNVGIYCPNGNKNTGPHKSSIEFNSDVSRGEGGMYFDYRYNPDRVFLVSEKFNTEFEIDEKILVGFDQGKVEKALKK